MILQALTEYYNRKAADPESNIAPEGWEWKEIPFIIVINEEGQFRDFIDTREGEDNKKRAKSFLVPKSEKRTVNIKPFLLWDNVEYCFGASYRNRSDIEERRLSFIKRIENDCLKLSNKVEIKSLLSFLKNDPISEIEKNISNKELWSEAVNSNAFVAFRLEDKPEGLISDIVKNINIKNIENDGICLITGKGGKIARLHPFIKGVRGTNTTGGSIVSFNLNSFKSFGKDQSFNSPITEETAFYYTTALNHLLDKESQNKLYLSDSTIIFWAEKKTDKAFDLESNFKWYIDDPPKDDPDRGIRSIKALYDSHYIGKQVYDEDNRFFILGLSPNSARISVRTWKHGTVTDFSSKIKQHFDDFEIHRGTKDTEFLSLGQILRAVVFEYKSENIPPNLSGKVLESVLDGTPYPETLLNLCINRIRAERHVTRTRAAIIKAYFNRFNRYYNNKEKEVAVSLDRDNKNIGYRLGRLFAVLEKIDEEGGSGTIRERFYSAASTSPSSVFSRLLNLKNHHLAKIENTGRKVNFEKELGEVFAGIDDFPSHLMLKDQGRFAVGYYHQRQNYFISKKDNEPKEV